MKTKVLAAIVMILLVLATPVSLITWVWTGDLRWLGSAVILIGCFVAIWILGDSEPKDGS